MPGSVAAASPSFVMPWAAASAFSQARQWQNDENRYRNGEVERATLVSTSRKRWNLSERVSAAQLSALRTFLLANPNVEFYFYDVFETSPRFTYDNTGAASTGRYAVRFEGGLQSSLGLGRNNAQVTLIEVA